MASRIKRRTSAGPARPSRRWRLRQQTCVCAFGVWTQVRRISSQATNGPNMFFREGPLPRPPTLLIANTNSKRKVFSNIVAKPSREGVSYFSACLHMFVYVALYRMRSLVCACPSTSVVPTYGCSHDCWCCGCLLAWAWLRLLVVACGCMRLVALF